MRNTAPVRRGALLFRQQLDRGVDCLITVIDGVLSCPRPAHLRGRQAKDWDYYISWLNWQNKSFADDAVREEAEKNEATRLSTPEPAPDLDDS